MPLTVNYLEPDDTGFVTPDSTPMDVNPGATIYILGKRQVTLQPEVVKSIYGGAMKAYFYGKLTFNDIDDNSHEAHYCFVYDPPNAGFRLCGNYNDSN
jgi:hypothetical protein